MMFAAQVKREPTLDANIDKTNFGATLVIILLVSIPLILNPVGGAALVQSA